MIFSRTYSYNAQVGAETIKGRLVGKHIRVHNMDFEVFEKDSMLRIIPHAEQETHIKTLPITHVQFKGKGEKTQVVINSKMRKIDSGGPFLIVIFCMFLLIAAVLFFCFGGAEYRSYVYILGGISVAIFLLFWVRMESGYFDYVRKLRDFIKNQSMA